MGFFDALYADVAGFVELRALPGGRSEFFKPDDSAGRSKYLDAYPGYNHYFGVATRADDSSGALENCLHLPALFVDIDRKAGTDLSRVETCQCPPSAIVESGGGWRVALVLAATRASGPADGAQSRMPAATGARGGGWG